MKIKFNLPNSFVPVEMEFKYYCAIKLLKANHINKEEAMNICNLKISNKEDIKNFNTIFDIFEKRYLELCGNGYSDEDF